MGDVKANMTKGALLAILAAAVFSGCGGAKPTPAGRLVQPAGEFSFVTPDGWFRTKLAGIDFVIVSAAPDGGARPNIFVDFVEASGRVSSAAAKLIDANRLGMRGYGVDGQREFAAESGLQGIKISAGRENRDGLPLAVFHYLVQDGSRVIAVTCLCARTVREKYEPVFDAAMGSLRSARAGRAETGRGT
jgi:hypothetical protein